MLQFRVNGQRIERIDDFEPVRDSINYLTAHFEFDESWHDTVRTAIFRAKISSSEVAHTILLTNICDESGITACAECIVPYDMLTVDSFTVSVYGLRTENEDTENETEVTITTDTEKIRVFKSGYNASLNPDPEPDTPEYDLLEQLQTAIGSIQSNYVPKDGNKVLSEVNFTAVYRDRLNAAALTLSPAMLGQWKPAEVGAIAHDHTPLTATSTTIALMPVPTAYTDLFTALDAWRIKVKEDEDTDGVPTDYDFVLAEYLINISVIENTSISFTYGGSAVSVDVIGGHHDISGNVYLTGGKSYRIHLRDGMGTVEEVSA